nr:MAG TPA: hypothetical protein [Crassvirales sp.]
MERKIGEVFIYEGKTYQVMKSVTGCTGCTFNYTVCNNKHFLGSCSDVYRTDGIDIIFKLVNNNMEIKDNTLTIEIPEGMKIDTENSDLTKGIIKFKNKNITYEDVAQACNSSFGSLVVSTYHIDKLLAVSKLMDIAKYYNKSWKPDWNNNREDKWYIYYDHSSHNYIVSSHVSFSEDNVYFKHRNDAIAVTNNLNFRDILNTIFNA